MNPQAESEARILCLLLTNVVYTMRKCSVLTFMYVWYTQVLPVESKSGFADDKQSLAPQTRGAEGKNSQLAPSSPGHTTREGQTTTAADVRTSITTSQQPTAAPVARRLQKNVGDSSGAQALAVLASVSSMLHVSFILLVSYKTICIGRYVVCHKGSNYKLCMGC